MTLSEKLASLEMKLKEAIETSAKIATLKAEIRALKKLIADEERGESRKSELCIAIVPEQAAEKGLSSTQEKHINTRHDGRDRVKPERDEEAEEPATKIFDADKSSPGVANYLSVCDRIPQDRRRLFSRTLSVLLAIAVSVTIGYLWFSRLLINP
jgi:hypothetical protein